MYLLHKNLFFSIINTNKKATYTSYFLLLSLKWKEVYRIYRHWPIKCEMLISDHLSHASHEAIIAFHNGIVIAQRKNANSGILGRTSIGVLMV